MNDRPAFFGLLLLVPAVLFGILRASDTLGRLSSLGDSRLPGEGGASGDLPGVEILAAAHQSDHDAESYRPPERGRSPFDIAPAPAPPSPPKRSVPVPSRGAPRGSAERSIPEVMAVLADQGRIAVVLEVDGVSSGPIAAGSTFREWEVVAVDWNLVLLSRRGVNYSLPVKPR